MVDYYAKLKIEDENRTKKTSDIMKRFEEITKNSDSPNTSSVVVSSTLQTETLPSFTQHPPIPTIIPASLPLENDIVSQMMSAIGRDRDVAIFFLESADWNLDQAIELFRSFGDSA